MAKTMKTPTMPADTQSLASRGAAALLAMMICLICFSCPLGAFAVAPVITSAGEKDGEVGVYFEYQITTQIGNATSYSAPDLPDGLSCSSATGLISGTPTLSANIVGTGIWVGDITLRATNGDGTGTKTLALRIHHRQRPTSTPPFPATLESRPGAAGLIYLDFDGEMLTSPEWNNGVTVQLHPSGLNDTQVRQIFEAVKEDFRPFNVNVTTRRDLYDARDAAGPPYRRIRMIVTPTDAWNPQVGADAICEQGAFADAGVTYVQLPAPPHVRDPRYAGLAFVRFFDANGTIVQTARDIASSISHEIGHGFGLHHDGNDYRPLGGRLGQYMPGTGIGISHGPAGLVGATTKNLSVWTPIMGSNTLGFLTQWSKGDYYGYHLGGTQPDLDDVAVIAGSTNGIGYAPDPEGGTTANATMLTVSDQVIYDGDIGRTSAGTPDIDVLRFTMNQPGVVNLLAKPREPMSDVFPSFTPLQQQELDFGITNLYMNVELLDASGTQIQVLERDADYPVAPSNPTGLEPAEFFRRRLSNVRLAAGTYYLRISGTGRGDPFVAPTFTTIEGGATVMTDYAGNFASYGSMGAYKIRGTIDYDPVITSASSVSATVGVLFNHPIVATNSPTGYDASNLPPGLSINPATGVISGAPTAAGTFNALVGAYRNLAVGYQTLTIVVAGSTSLADAVDAPSLVWGAPTVPSDFRGWFRQTLVTHDSVDAAQSADLEDSQRAGLQTTVTGPGTLTFWWKVSSETRWDALRFEIDGQMHGSAISGVGADWVQVTAPIGTGVHSLRWIYEKDGSVSVGDDAGWVDQVAYTQIYPPVVNSASTINLEQGSAANYQITASNSPTSYVPDPQGGSVPGMSLNQATGVYSGTPTVTGTFQVTLGAANAAGTGYLALAVNVVPSMADSVDNFTQSFSRSGAGNWMGQTAVAQVGGDALRSAAIGDNENCSFYTQVTGPLNLSFWWRTDCEATNDYLVLEDYDGFTTVERAGRISGNTNWTQVNVSLPSGTRIIRWRYVKNGSVSAGADAGWVDGIQFGPTLPVITSASSISRTVGNALSFTITATNSPTITVNESALPPGIAFSPTQNIIVGVPYQGGTWSTTVQATNSSGTTTQTLTFHIESSRSAWNRNNGFAGENALPTADSDRDGLPNLLEMALQRNPSVRDDAYNPAGQDPATGRLRAIFRHDQRYRDITYLVETSSDLSNWTPLYRIINGVGDNVGGATVGFTSIAANVWEVTVVDPAGPTPGGRRFMRIRIIEQ